MNDTDTKMEYSRSECIFILSVIVGIVVVGGLITSVLFAVVMLLLNLNFTLFNFMTAWVIGMALDCYCIHSKGRQVRVQCEKSILSLRSQGVFEKEEGRDE